MFKRLGVGRVRRLGALAALACAFSVVPAEAAEEVDPGLPGAAAGAPSLIQSSAGRTGNFELLTGAEDGGLDLYWRHNDDVLLPWRGPQRIAGGTGDVTGVSLIQSRLRTPGDLEAAFVGGGRLWFVSRDAATLRWSTPALIAHEEVRANPALIQGRFGVAGNFEVVVPAASGGLLAYHRDNDARGRPWLGPVRFASELGAVDGVALIQNTTGDLEVVANARGRLVSYRRGQDLVWRAAGGLGTGATGTPAMIQSTFGRTGNVEVLVGRAGGGVDAYWRDNDAPGRPWRGPDPILGTEPVDAVTLMQSSYGTGNLEAIVRSGRRLDFAYREGAGRWTGPLPLAAPLVPPPSPGEQPAPELVKGRTEALGVLLQRRGRGGPNDLTRAGIRGTDLGSSFEFGGKLQFLFGDAWMEGDRGLVGNPDFAPARLFNRDASAWTNARSVAPGTMPTLHFPLEPGKDGPVFKPLSVDGLDAAQDFDAYEVPMDGVELPDGGAAVFLATDFHKPETAGEHPERSRYDTSVLARMRAPGDPDMTLVARSRSERFLNVSLVRSGAYAYVFGAGNPYRRSDVYVARVPIDELAPRTPSTLSREARELLDARDRWRYFRGTRRGRPVWGRWESSAAGLLGSRCVGEFSVRRHDATGLYLMTYHCDVRAGSAEPSRVGYVLRTARTPWGPWSRAELIYDDASASDGGAGVTTHRPGGPDDGLGQPDHSVTPAGGGAPYGPYMVPRWSRTLQPGRHSIVYTHSSWVPYTVNLMRTTLVRPGAAVLDTRLPLRGTEFVNGTFEQGLAGWTPAGTLPYAVVRRDGVPWATTHVAGGATGALAQEIRVGSGSRRVAFEVQGASAAVRLVVDGETVRETRGTPDGAVIAANWNVEPYWGRRVRVEIVADATGPGGAVSACCFRTATGSR